MKKTTSGFTIVELLIVIVVIAILATISIVAYGGIQVRSRDAMRSDAIAKIQRALELYKADNGRYPTATPSPGANGGWEASIDDADTFIEALKPYGFSAGTPLDPINNATYRFLYYRYPADGGGRGCTISNGGFYVLLVRYENASNKLTGNSIAADCTAPQAGWSDNSGTNYAFHAYEN